MGLFNSRNINKAKQLFDKNKDKIGSTVSKATDTIDQKTGGKYADHLRKVDDAAKKLGGDETPDGGDERDRLRPDESEGTASDLHPDPDAPKPNS